MANMARYVGMAGIQFDVLWGQDNTQIMLDKLDMCQRLFPWVELIFFSELSVCGLDETLAQSIPNASTRRLCEWAEEHQKWIIPGSMYEKEDLKIYNTAVAISPKGQIAAKYRKIFPWVPVETSAPGGQFCVFDIPGKGRVGLCICYDQWFPEVIRTLAWIGAEVILNPTATTTSDRALEKVLAQAHAITNQLYYLSVNGVGSGGNGQSIFVDPEGRVLQVSGEREMIMTEVIDLDRVTHVREYGTLGLSQVWKNFADSPITFPVYRERFRDGEIFKSLGKFRRHEKIE
jgi:predicted amidohydrolase